MLCAIYSSARKQDTYLYMACRDDFSQVPASLLELLGRLIHVMDLELQPERKLAQEDVVEVIRQLQRQGWYLQLPRREDELRLNRC